MWMTPSHEGEQISRVAFLFPPGVGCARRKEACVLERGRVFVSQMLCMRGTAMLKLKGGRLAWIADSHLAAMPFT